MRYFILNKIKNENVTDKGIENIAKRKLFQFFKAAKHVLRKCNFSQMQNVTTEYQEAYQISLTFQK